MIGASFSVSRRSATSGSCAVSFARSTDSPMSSTMVSAAEGSRVYASARQCSNSSGVRRTSFKGFPAMRRTSVSVDACGYGRIHTSSAPPTTRAASTPFAFAKG